MRPIFLALFLVPMLLAPVAGQRSPLCGGWQDCRRLALEARDQRDYDRFHDLAWAALQAGPKNDPDLMYLVAHAQVLSNRPHNALVMLQRLADAGVATDADTDPDFEQTRLLPGWPDVAAAMARVRAVPGSAAAVTRSVPASTVSPAGAPVAAGSFSPAAAASFVSAGLAYDIVSRRFVVGDTLGHKLLVVGAGATHSDDLVHIDAAGFADLTAFGIDEQRGTLWVAGSSASTGESGLQRLQLVSGRALRSYPAQAATGPAHLIDLAILGSGEVIALDSTGNRLMSLANTGAELTAVMDLKLSGVTSLARRDDGVLYVAHDAGIARVDLRRRAVAAVTGSKDVDLGRFETIRMYRGALIGFQAAANGSKTLVRLTMNQAGGAVTGAAVLDTPSSRPDRRLSLAISGDDLYYLAGDAPDPQPAPNPSTPRTQIVIRRIGLR